MKVKMINKKGLGPIVATSLLIVVAVIATIAFQGWFGGYQTSLNVKVESQSGNEVMSTGIETMIGSTIFIKNGYDNLIIDTIKIDGKDCDFNDSLKNLESGMQHLNLDNCFDNLSTNSPEVLIVTDKGIMSKYIFLKDVNVTYIQPPKSCFLDGVNVAHDNSYIFSNYSQVPYGSTCSYEERTCDDGIFLGNESFEYSDCEIEIAILNFVQLNNNTLYLDSSIDVNLTSLEVSDNLGNLMCSFSGDGIVDNSGLVGWWTFNEGEGTIVYDKSGNQNHGDLKSKITINVTQIIDSNLVEIVSVNNNNTFNGCKFVNFDILIEEDIYIDANRHNLVLNDTNLVEGLYNITCGDLPLWTKTSYGKGLYLDGIDDYVIVNDNPSLDFNNSNQYSMIAFYDLKISSIDHNIKWPILLGKRPHPYGGYMAHFNRDADYLNNQFCFPNLCPSTQMYDSKLTLPGLNFYVGQYNQSHMTIYRNTQLESIRLENRSLGSNAGTNLQFGPLNGIYYEIMIFNRSLEEIEIEQIYNNFLLSIYEGINEIDVSSCNLNQDETYNITTIANNQKIEGLLKDD